LEDEEEEEEDADDDNQESSDTNKIQHQPIDSLSPTTTIPTPTDESKVEKVEGVGVSSLVAISKSMKKKKKTLIMKPSIGSQGKGIELVQDKAHMLKFQEKNCEPGYEFVCQEYISSPLLLRGLKVINSSSHIPYIHLQKRDHFYFKRFILFCFLISFDLKKKKKKTNICKHTV
jgi:hypothetical protein